MGLFDAIKLTANYMEHVLEEAVSSKNERFVSCEYDEPMNLPDEIMIDEIHNESDTLFVRIDEDE